MSQSLVVKFKFRDPKRFLFLFPPQIQPLKFELREKEFHLRTDLESNKETPKIPMLFINLKFFTLFL